MSVPDRRALVDRDRGGLSIRRQCALLCLARSGVYRPPRPANDNVSVLFSLTRDGAERLKTSSCCRRKRISASRETRDPRIDASSALKNARTLDIRARD